MGLVPDQHPATDTIGGFMSLVHIVISALLGFLLWRFGDQGVARQEQRADARCVLQGATGPRSFAFQLAPADQA